jgi:hypothetical protein
LAWGGIANENACRDAYVALSGIDDDLVVRAPLRTHAECNHICAVPDFLVGENGLLEIKCPYSVALEGAEQPVELKLKWLLQVHLQLEIFDREWCDVVAWDSDFLWLWRVYRQRTPDPLVNLLLPEYKKFGTAVNTGQPPVGTDSATIDAIRSSVSNFRRTCVTQVRASPDGSLEWATTGERRNDPRHFTLVDRFANPLSEMDQKGLPFASRGLYVHWIDDETYWTFQNGRNGQGSALPKPGGGFIRFKYYTVNTTHNDLKGLLLRGVGLHPTQPPRAGLRPAQTPNPD